MIWSRTKKEERGKKIKRAAREHKKKAHNSYTMSGKGEE